MKSTKQGESKRHCLAGSKREWARRLKQRQCSVAFEQLEPRLLLSADPITSEQAQSLQRGLDALADFGHRLDNFGDLDKTLPLVDSRVGSALDVGDVLHELLVTTVSDYLQSDDTPTTDGLVAALQSVLTNGTTELSFDAGFSVAGAIIDPDELRFDLSFTARRSRDVSFDLGANAPSQGLRLDAPPTVPLETTLIFSFSFGVDLAGSDFFLRTASNDGASPLQLQANAEATLPDFEIVAGFTKPTVQGGTVSLDANLDVAFSNPDGDPRGNLSIIELEGDLNALVTVTPSGDAGATLPVTVSFLDFSQGGDPQIILSDDAPFDEIAPTITVNNDFAPITATNDQVAEALRQGLRALADFAQDLDATDKLATPMFLVSGSIGDFLDLGTVVQTHVTTPVIDRLNAVGAPLTFEDVIGVLATQSGVFGDLVLTLDATGQRVDDSLQIDLTLSAMRTTESVALDLGDDINELLLIEDLTGVVTTTANWDFQLNIDLAEFPATGDAFSGHFASPLAVTADLALPNLETAARAGFLGLSLGAYGGHQSAITLDADVAIVIANPGNDSVDIITLAALREQGTALATQSGTALIDIGLFGISGVPGVANDPSDPASIVFHDDALDAIDGSRVDNFVPLGVADFLDTNSEEMRSLLVQFEGFLSSASSSSLFDTSIPLTKNETLADVFDLGEIFNEQVTGLLVEPDTGNEEFNSSNFTTLQEFAERLGSSLGSLTYDPVGKQLQFDIGLNDVLETVEDTVKFFDIAPLSGLTSESAITLDATADLQLRFSMLLTEIGSNVGPISESTPVALLNRGRGIRTNDDDSPDIRITLGNGSLFEVDLNHEEVATLGDVIDRIELAADDAGLSSVFEIRIDESQTGLELVDRTGGNQPLAVSQIEQPFTVLDLGLLGKEAEEGIPGEQLISGGPLHGDTLADHFGVRNSAIDSAIDISFALAGAGVSAQGRWGDLAISIEEGLLSGSVAIGMQLTDPETDAADGLATLRELQAGLADPGELFAPTPSGWLSIDLPLYPNPSFAGLSVIGDPPVFHADVPNILDPASLTFTLQADPSDEVAALLEELAELKVADVLAAVQQSADYLIQLETSDAVGGVPDTLARELPGLGVSISELLPVGSTWRKALDSLAASDTLQDLESQLAAHANVSALTLSFDSTTSALLLDFQLHGDKSDAIPLELNLTTLDLTSQGVTLEELGLDVVGVVADTDAASPIAVDASRGSACPPRGSIWRLPPPPLFSRTPRSSLIVSPPLSRSSVSEPCSELSSVDILGGTFVLDADGAGAGTAPASYELRLVDVPGDRYPLGSAAASTTATITGAMNADLPVDFGVIAGGQPDIEVMIGDLGDLAGSTSLSGPDVATLLESLTLEEILPSFLMGFDQLFGELASALDSCRVRQGASDCRHGHGGSF